LDFIVFGEADKLSVSVPSTGLEGTTEGDEGDIATSLEEVEESDESGVNWVRGEEMVIGEATEMGVAGVIGEERGDSTEGRDNEVWEVAGGSCRPSAIFLSN
jgi:hypothetical protein